MNINSIAASDVMCLMEAYVLLELHEKINIPSLLTNAESWNLNKGEMDNLERIELQAIKQLFNLPVHTPTPAIIFTFGLLYTRFRIHQKQLLYLHKILKRYSHWTKQTLMVLQSKNMGWYKTIMETLNEHEMPTDLATITSIPRRTWAKTK